MLYMVIFFISASFLGFWLVYMSRREDNGFYTILMMKGGSPGTYFLANFVIEVFILFTIGMIMWAFLAIIQVPMPFFFVPVMLWAIAESVFLHFCLDFFMRRCFCNSTNLGFLLLMFYVLAMTFGQIGMNLLHLHKFADIVSICLSWLPVNNFASAAAHIMVKQLTAIEGEQVFSLGTDGCLWQLVQQICCIVFYSLMLLLGSSGCCSCFRSKEWVFEPIIS